ncbi:TetR family transcriptional regulator [Bosea caraganae]|uniref:TetR family transcriptional regulator n=1 Tax=Bosea caraganae TaxID=2763117 RepID=A0A370KXU6_9HYPH|nr:TetR/AcrR family transcriptional regulator [Bosea caraganae]RDJ19801.1 TetR family transcriptional regulator [Bosea caraganae]RDJ30060.1 TetR family transcriptional regulator [Bosea caraganae]
MPRLSLKEKIVVSAVETLHRKGFNGCSVQDITEAAGVPKGSFYNHFQSKEDLAVAALERYWHKVQASLLMLGDQDGPGMERLARYFRHLNDLTRQNAYETGCLVGNMAAEMSDQSASIRERLAGLLADWSGAIEACVQAAQADGSMRRDIDSRSIAACLLNAWEGAIMRAKVDRSHRPLEDFDRVVLASLRA